MSFFLIFVAILVAVAGYFYIQLGKAAGPPPKPRSPVPASNGTAAKGAAAPAAAGGKKVTVVYGSQTGTAEMFAKTLAREGAKLGVPIVAVDVENYEAYDLETEKLVILVCATYGEGEPTDTMKDFHDWVLDEVRAPGEELAQVKYCVFGLGDRQYKYFCEEAIAMDRRFDELGAERIYGLQCGDAGNGQLEEEFDEWRKDLWPAVGRALNITVKENIEESVDPECRIKYWEEAEAPLAFPRTASVNAPTQRMPVWVPVTKNEELLKNCPDRSTRDIRFSISGTIISYQAGDHFGVLPCNKDSVVEDYLKILGVSDEDAAKVFSLQDIKTLKNVFPARVSVRSALKWYVDLAGHPKKSTLRAFAHCCEDPKDKEELLRLLRVGPEAQKDFSKLCGKLRTMHGFLRKYASAKVPLAFFFELMPRITPRYFSISSDLLADDASIGITAAVMEGGLCTTMLADLKEGDRVPVFVRSSTFHLPLRDKDRPAIMIGPGTGVAPLIGFLHRRRAWQQKGNAIGKAILFFGCRKESEDFIYEDLCTAALRDGVISSLDVAFSRDQPEKVYVQHRIAARAAELWDLIENRKANVYICGDAKHMAKDVEQELTKIVMQQGGLSEEAAKEYLAKLESSDRYLKDVWSSA